MSAWMRVEDAEPEHDYADDETPRYLLLGDAPVLTGETAAAVVALLEVLVEEIRCEYAPELEARQRRQARRRFEWRDPQAPWRPLLPERQLALDLDEHDQPF